MLFDHVGWPHFLLDELVDVDEHIIHVLIPTPKANGTLVDVVLIITASPWLGHLVFLIFL
jgi:hypothetical protein